VAANAGAATTILWAVVVGLFVAVCVIVALIAAYAHSPRSPRGTAITGVVLLLAWVFAAVLLREVAVASVAAAGGVSA
jgi:hypothetical protein